MKKGLTATQLKLIAVCAMICDHCAWAFVDMFSVQGQIMHTIGRLTIPIMCFFVAEGYRKTSNVQRYAERMLLFAMISIPPFYMFFSEEYGYRQNFIFDLFLALMLLIVVDHKKLRKWQKVLFATGLILVSAIIGGWPLFPMFLVLLFYYAKSYRTRLWLGSGLTILTLATVTTLIILNETYHFWNYDWVWYQWFYFLGFIPAIALTGLYNGKRGQYPFGRYFFYIMYPAHLLVLYTIRLLLKNDWFNLYIGMHVLCLFGVVLVAFNLLKARPSKALLASFVLTMSGAVYIFALTIEKYTYSGEVAYAATMFEYFGECFVLLGFLWFVSEMCHIRLPKILYVWSGCMSFFLLFLLCTNRKHNLFYQSFHLVTATKPHRLVINYGVGFYLFIVHMLILCVITLCMNLYTIFRVHGLERKRIALVMLSTSFPWISFGLQALGLTGGYEISALGSLLSMICLYRVIVTYEYLDSVQLAGENALHQIQDAILVIDTQYRVLYHNTRFDKLFPWVHDYKVITRHQNVMDMFHEKITQYHHKDKIYNVSIVPLREHEITQGSMLVMRDMTQHFKYLDVVQKFANTDSLTGLSNRTHFASLFNELHESGETGTLLMMDVDNFKTVNDTYGHNIGDVVLKQLALAMQDIAGSTHIPCRLGGDEFCMYLHKVDDIDEIRTLCQNLSEKFAEYLEKENLADVTSITIGAAAAIEATDDFAAVYKRADQLLYQAKQAQRGSFFIAKMNHETKE